MQTDSPNLDNYQPSAPIQLQYGTSPPRWRRRLRLVVLAITLGLIFVVAIQWGPQIWRQTRVLYLQRQCLNHRLPPDQVVYEEDPLDVPKLLGRRDYLARLTIDPMSSGLRMTDEPMQLTAASYRPACWTSFCEVGSVRSFSNPRRPPAVIFLGRLTTPTTRKEILVALTYFPDHRMFQPVLVNHFNCEAVIVAPATLTNPPGQRLPVVRVGTPWSVPRRPPNTRFYAGQIDPADPSHFTVRYEMWGQQDTLDGRLGEDLQVHLSQRQVPQWPRD